VERRHAVATDHLLNSEQVTVCPGYTEEVTVRPWNVEEAVGNWKVDAE